MGCPAPSLGTTRYNGSKQRNIVYSSNKLCPPDAKLSEGWLPGLHIPLFQQYLVTPHYPSTWKDTGVHNIFEAVEPGILSATSVFLWRTRAQINKLVHTMQGNRGQRGRGITCLHWNKGPSLLTNKQADIKSIIADHKPHILGLGEANLKNGQDFAPIVHSGLREDMILKM